MSNIPWIFALSCIRWTARTDSMSRRRWGTWKYPCSGPRIFGSRRGTSPWIRRRRRTMLLAETESKTLQPVRTKFWLKKTLLENHAELWSWNWTHEIPCNLIVDSARNTLIRCRLTYVLDLSRVFPFSPNPTNTLKLWHKNFFSVLNSCPARHYLQLLLNVAGLNCNIHKLF